MIIFIFYLQLYTISNKFHKNRFQFNSWTEFTTSTYARYKEIHVQVLKMTRFLGFKVLHNSTPYTLYKLRQNIDMIYKNSPTEMERKYKLKQKKPDLIIGTRNKMIVI